MLIHCGLTESILHLLSIQGSIEIRIKTLQCISDNEISLSNCCLNVTFPDLAQSLDQNFDFCG